MEVMDGGGSGNAGFVPMSSFLLLSFSNVVGMGVVVGFTTVTGVLAVVAMLLVTAANGGGPPLPMFGGNFTVGSEGLINVGVGVVAGNIVDFLIAF